MNLKSIRAWGLGVLLCVAAHAQDAPPTWSREVAPIIYQHCTTCHRPDGAGPFALGSYTDVQQRAKLIAKITGARTMPPWRAERGELKFTNERGLSDAEIATLQAWVDAGAPEGDPAAAPAPPVFNSEWHNGPPDLLLEMEGDYTVPAGGPDVYRNFVVRIPPLPKGKYLKGIDYKPRAQQSAHHTLYALDSTGEMRHRAEASGVAGFSGMESNLSTRRVGGWAVGAQPELFPPGISVAIPDGTDLLLNAHFHPSGKPETERARIALYLTDQAPTRDMIALDLPFGFGILANMRIPAGDAHYVVESEFTLPAAAELSGLAPHAHLLAREISARATLPDGKELTLVNVHDWDFAWQEQYRYAQPPVLPAGTKLNLRFVYDNSEGNVHNPNHPPKEVTWGPNTTDEMACVTMRFVSDDKAAVEAIRNGYGAWVKEAITHADLGLIEHAVRGQERDRIDLNSDGKITWEERFTSLKLALRKLGGSSQDELGLIPFIAWFIVKTEVLPRAIPVILVVWLVVHLLRRRRRRMRSA